MTTALFIEDLRKTYKNGLQALKGIDLKVAQGDFFALLGPNGAGKSTMIGIICSLINKTSGNVSVFGHNLDRKHFAAKRFIGLVPQEFNFNQFEPAIEIVVNQAGYYGINRKRAFVRAEYLLKQLGLWDRQRTKARELSGGMKRRLMIARALVHEPKLLILDEPTAGVDIEIRRSMWDFIRGINIDGTTIILTTHYLEEAESLCRNIAIIDEGQIIENTEMRTLLSKLKMESFVLDLKHPIETVPAIKFADIVQIDSATIEVTMSKKQSINDLFTALSKRNIEVLSMRNKTNRLEELFMTLVNEKTGVPN